MSEALPLVERHERIVAYLAGHGSATVEELSAAFAVSAVTIRSDLRSLQRQLRVRRARGHAIAIEPPSGGAPRGADDGLRALGEAGPSSSPPGTWCTWTRRRARWRSPSRWHTGVLPGVMTRP
ncbi:DeoR family transcriptional regulator [Luedemannella flava]